MALKIVVTSILVDDQEKALAFYRDLLGFEVKHDIPLGHHRWLTLTAPGDGAGVELLLEPDEHPAARPFNAALQADGIHTLRSASTTCRPNTPGFRQWACALPNLQQLWVQ